MAVSHQTGPIIFHTLSEASVPLVFSVRTHQYERLSVDGVSIVSGGDPAYAPGEMLPESKKYARASHFVLVEVLTDRIEIMALLVAGQTLDHTRIPLP